MKNKTRILLVALTAGLWSLIIYKVISSLGGGKEDVTPAASAQVLARAEKAQTGSDMLLLNYRDPFMNSPRTGTIKTKRTAPVVVKAPLRWPVIIFKGTIASQQGKSNIIIADINGKETIMRQGVMTDSITLVRICADSALFRFRKERKFIKRN